MGYQLWVTTDTHSKLGITHVTRKSRNIFVDPGFSVALASSARLNNGPASARRLTTQNGQILVDIISVHTETVLCLFCGDLS